MYYCNREHQLAHTEEHKGACSAVEKARAKLEREETNPNVYLSDLVTPTNSYEDYEGHMRDVRVTDEYILARYALGQTLLEIRTYKAIDEADGHMHNMLRFCENRRSINDLPILKLRLGRDQQCYDFCKWYATIGQSGRVDCLEMDSPYFEIQDADVFEPLLEAHLSRSLNLSHAVAITLLKVRLLIDLGALQNSSLIRGKVPPEILDILRYHLVSSVTAANSKVMNSKDPIPLIQSIETQVQNLFMAVKRSSRNFWPSLVDTGPRLMPLPVPRRSSKGRTSKAEMRLTLQNIRCAWEETPGAIDMIRDLVRRD